MKKFVEKYLWARPNKEVQKLVDLYIEQHHQTMSNNDRVNFLDIAKLAYLIGRYSKCSKRVTKDK